MPNMVPWYFSCLSALFPSCPLTTSQLTRPNVTFRCFRSSIRFTHGASMIFSYLKPRHFYSIFKKPSSLPPPTPHAPFLPSSSFSSSSSSSLPSLASCLSSSLFNGIKTHSNMTPHLSVCTKSTFPLLLIK